MAVENCRKESNIDPTQLKTVIADQLQDEIEQVVFEFKNEADRKVNALQKNVRSIQTT